MSKVVFNNGTYLNNPRFKAEGGLENDLKEMP